MAGSISSTPYYSTSCGILKAMSRSKHSGPDKQPVNPCASARGGMVGRAICSLKGRGKQVEKAVDGK